MMRSIVLLRAFAGLALMGLVACGTPPDLGVEGMRPGIASTGEYARAELRPGVSALYRVVLPEGAPVDMSMRIRTRPGKGRTIDYTGDFRMTVPGGNVAEIAKVLLPGDVDLPFKVLGDAVIFPGSGVLDRKGRTLVTRTRLQSARFEPHDCWAVLGRCASTAIGPDGERISVIVETREEGGFWYSTTRLDPAKMRGARKLLSQRVYSIDRNLLPIDLKIRDLEERPDQSVLLRRIR